MLHPATTLAFIDSVVGHGVVATEPIPRGTIVWTLDPLDQVFPIDRGASLPDSCRALLEKYSYEDGLGNLVLCWDHARFVNHSCDANCLGPADLGFEIAIRDIAAGEQLTDDYRDFGAEEDFPCACGAPHCTGTVSPGADPQVAAEWRRRLVEGLADLFSVPQPLWSLVPDRDILEAMREVGPERMLRPDRTTRPGRPRLAI